MATTIAFFGSKPYDEASFNEKNQDFGFELRFYKGHLNKNNVILTQGVDVVCIFVNDTANAEVLHLMAQNGVKLLALRCAGYNNVDLKAAAECGIPVVRVPAYSPYAVAEYTVALMLSLNRKIHRAAWRTREGNFSLHGLLGFDMHGKTAGIIGTTDEGVDFLCLFGSGSLASTDSPYRLVSQDDLTEILSGKVEQRTSDLSVYYLEVLTGFSLFQNLTDAEDRSQTVSQSQLNLRLQDFRSLMIISTSLRVA